MPPQPPPRPPIPCPRIATASQPTVVDRLFRPVRPGLGCSRAGSKGKGTWVFCSASGVCGGLFRLAAAKVPRRLPLHFGAVRLAS